MGRHIDDKDSLIAKFKYGETVNKPINYTFSGNFAFSFRECVLSSDHQFLDAHWFFGLQSRRFRILGPFKWFQRFVVYRNPQTAPKKTIPRSLDKVLDGKNITVYSTTCFFGTINDWVVVSCFFSPLPGQMIQFD